MLKQINSKNDNDPISLKISDASFPSPFVCGLEYSAPARGMWNIVHTGMLIPESHQIFFCAASCLRGVVLTAAEMHAQKRFSTIEIRENNVLEGNMEALIIDGTADILSKLSYKPKAVLLYTSCIHHFIGCDLNLVYRTLRENHPDIDFTDCYMNPIMRKSGRTPDQIMRSRLYSLLKPVPLSPKSLAIIGNDLPTDTDSELYACLRDNGFKIHEITDCRNYEEYQSMADSSYYISYYPPAKVGGDDLSNRLKGKHIYIPLSYSYEKIRENYKLLSNTLNIESPDYTELENICEEKLKNTLSVIGTVPIEIDYTATPAPLSLAKLLLTHGFNVKCLYCDSFNSEEKEEFDFLKDNYPDLIITATVNAQMRTVERNDIKTLCIGQKSAFFTCSKNFVNIIEGGGYYGYSGINKICLLMEDAYLNEKETKELIQIKGMGCNSCI